jgi:uncharacterized phage-associated protein
MITSEAAARYFLTLASREGEALLLTPMHLQKLLYYAQGWTLGVRGSKLFSGDFEAWVYGPVCREIYSMFAAYGKSPIPDDEARADSAIPPGDRCMLEFVYDRYRKYSAPELSRMTHAEQPWIAARGPHHAEERSSSTLKDEDMRIWFATQYQRLMRRTPAELAEIERSAKQAREGHVVTLNLVTGELSE